MSKMHIHWDANWNDRGTHMSSEHITELYFNFNVKYG